MFDRESSGESNRTSFARGGPIYVPNIVGPITSVLEFKAAVLQELQSLEAEVCSAGDFNDEINVDELKVLTEEELVEKALEEGFEGNQHRGHVLHCCDYSNGVEISSSTNTDNARETNAMQSSQFTNASSPGTYGEKPIETKSQQSLKKRKKRGRVFDRESRAADLEASLARVEQLAELKKKQDEDKAAARLHSFNGNSNPAEGNISNLEKTERIRALRFITCPLKQAKPSATLTHVPVVYPEVVLCFEIHGSRVTSKKQEFLVLGSQKLTELRDNIYCSTDQLMQSAGHHDPSGYFLIEDTFANDFRDQSATDYSKPILDWLNNCKAEADRKWENIMSGQLMKKQKELLGNSSKPNLPTFKSVDMDSTRFCDLRFRLGAGYLFCHQGDCKHTVVIRDMRLIHPEDNQNMAAYPIRTYQYKLRHHKCSVCFMRGATKVTVDDKWAQKNPCYFCDNCYYLLHYNEDGSLLYNDFTVYDHYHD